MRLMAASYILSVFFAFDISLIMLLWIVSAEELYKSQESMFPVMMMTTIIVLNLAVDHFLQTLFWCLQKSLLQVSLLMLVYEACILRKVSILECN